MTRRQDMIRQHMETAGLDACVFTSYHNVFYFSDFLYCKFGRNYAFIITPEKSITVSAGGLCFLRFLSIMIIYKTIYNNFRGTVIRRLPPGLNFSSSRSYKIEVNRIVATVIGKVFLGKF